MISLGSIGTGVFGKENSVDRVKEELTFGARTDKLRLAPSWGPTFPSGRAHGKSSGTELGDLVFV